jgi:hypothetical protein
VAKMEYDQSRPSQESLNFARAAAIITPLWFTSRAPPTEAWV